MQVFFKSHLDILLSRQHDLRMIEFQIQEGAVFMLNYLIFCFWKRPSTSWPVRVPVPETKITNDLCGLPEEGILVFLRSRKNLHDFDILDESVRTLYIGQFIYN
jgi:hypothetical protein